ncbi:hypothetical protein INT45_008323 [Circinella minor]|uniref:C2H2-type domain-containing protein n=1 Tax=Circinella minor TaxID=1195481 RepID=A0A8H7RFQ5_9FUNG|nr:hypothetical protein INT45_008323 [Circinella minor]
MSQTKQYNCTFHDDMTKSICAKKYMTQSALNKHIRKHHEYRYGEPGPTKSPDHKKMTNERSKRYRDTYALSIRRKENTKRWLRKGVEKASSLMTDSASTLKSEIATKAKYLFEQLAKSPAANQKPFLHATLVCLVMREAQYNFGMHEFVHLLNHLFGDGFYSTVLQFDELEKKEEFEWVAQQIYNKRSLVLALGSIVQDVVAQSYFYHKSSLFTYKAQEAIKNF